MKILNIAESYLSDKPADLAGVFIHRQSLALRELGYDIRVINPQPLICRNYFSKFYPYYSEKDGIKIFRPKFFYIPFIMNLGKIYDFFYSWSVSHTVNDFSFQWKPDLIICDWIIPGGYASAQISKRLGIPLILRARGGDVRWMKLKIKKLRNYFLDICSQASSVICNGVGLFNDLLELGVVNEEKLIVITNGIDTSFFHKPSKDERISARQHFNIPINAKVCIFVGSWAKHKGTEEIAKVMPSILKKSKDVYFIVSGPILDKESQHAFCDVNKQTLFLGMVSQEKIRMSLTAADIFILPSHNEGLPNALIEAMATNLACIVTEVGGVPYLIQNNVNGLLIKRKNISMLERAIYQCLSDSVLINRLGKNAHETIFDQKLDMQSIIAKLDRFIRYLTTNDILG